MKLFGKNVRYKPLIRTLSKRVKLVLSIVLILIGIVGCKYSILLPDIYFWKDSVWKFKIASLVAIYTYSLILYYALRVNVGMIYVVGKEFWDEGKYSNPRGIEDFINVIKSFPIKRLSLFEEVTSRNEIVQKRSEI